jgi:trehalose-phosphatase
LRAPVLRPLSRGVDPERFFARVTRSKARVLLLDFDGTLAPFETRPDCVKPYPRVIATLDRIMAQPGSRVVIVTGRGLDVAAPPLALKRAPEVWGAHGWQRLVPGAPLAVYEPPSGAREILSAAQAQALPLRARGARVEAKPASVAVHWRGLPVASVQMLRAELRWRWHAVCRSPQLKLVHFDGGMELRILGHDEGVVVNKVLAGAGAETAAAYLGDDTTDEDAFLAIEGRGLGVLVRRALRPTRARAWLRPPRELAAFLQHWCECGEPV